MIATLDEKVKLYNDIKSTAHKITNTYEYVIDCSPDYLERVNTARSYAIDAHITHLACVLEELSKTGEKISGKNWLSYLKKQLLTFDYWINETIDKWNDSPMKGGNSDLMFNINWAVENIEKMELKCVL